MSRRMQVASVACDSMQLPSNPLIIARCIEQELAEARACDEVLGEAETRVASMLRSGEFANLRMVVRFRIADKPNFSEWSVTLEYLAGQPFVVDQDSLREMAGA